MRGKLLSRFFLWSVFLTHSLTVYERGNFYTLLGMDPGLFDAEVMRLSSDIRFWSSGDTKTGPPDGLLTGALRRPLDRCFIGGCRVVVVGCGIFAA